MRFWFGKGAWISKAAQKRLRHLKPEDVKSIAIIRHAALGDMILTRPFIYECRKYFPNAKITLSLVSNYTRGAPEDMVDRIHVAIGRDQKQVSMKQQIKVAKELGYHDLLFDLAATSRSFWVTFLNKANIKLGFPGHFLQRHFFYDIAVLRSDLRFEAETMTDILNAIGVKTSIPLVFDLPGEVYKADRNYIVYFTGASSPYKCWPDENFYQLISELSSQYSEMDHVILEGVGGDESVQALMKSLAGFDNVVARKIDTVEDTLAFIRGSQLVISNDTGIRHLAIAGGVRSIGIFALIDTATSCPFRYWPRFEQHEIAITQDGSWPTADDVFRQSTKLLSK